MANEKTMNARFQQKHDIAENWLKATNFIPKAGEIIVYDDLNKIKIGDGTTNVNELPFIEEETYINVASLPETNINDKIAYRVLEGTFIGQKRFRYDATCHVVETLPETGESALVQNNDDLSYVGYYNINDNEAYAYINNDTKALLIQLIDESDLNDLAKLAAKAVVNGMATGWKTFEEFINLIGSAVSMSWGGVIYTLEEITSDTALYLFIGAKTYYRNNGVWTSGDFTIGRRGTDSDAEVFNDLNNIASAPYAHAEGSLVTASGAYSHAEGYRTEAGGLGAHAEGQDTHAIGSNAHAEGYNTKANGNYSHAEGSSTEASHWYAHAEGANSIASGEAAHAEGLSAEASGAYSHAEGQSTNAEGMRSHAEGHNTVAKADASHAGGKGTIAARVAQTAIGSYNEENTSALFIVGNGTADTDRKNAFVVNSDGSATIAKVGENDNNVATVGYVKANTGSGGVGEKYINENGDVKGEIFNDYANNTAGGGYTHAEGYMTHADSWGAHAEGGQTNALGNYSHAEGLNTSAIGEASHVEGYKTSTGFKGYSKLYDVAIKTDTIELVIESTEPAKYYSVGDNLQIGLVDGPILKDKFKISSIYETNLTSAVPDGTYIELSKLTDENITITTDDIRYIGVYNKPYGDIVIAEGAHAHSEGYNTLAIGENAHAEGYGTQATKQHTHAEGYTTTATAWGAHAEGGDSHASGQYAHAEGLMTKAEGEGAHSEGRSTKAIGARAHAEGYNTQAVGENSHAEGKDTVALGKASHAEGTNTITGAKCFDAGNRSFSGTTSGNGKISIDLNSTTGLAIGQKVGFASDSASLSTALSITEISEEPKRITLEGTSSDYNLAKNFQFTTIYIIDHPELGDTARPDLGKNAHASGLGTIASANNQTAIGQYNATDANALFIIGNGTSDTSRNNAFIVNKDGTAYVQNDKKLATEEYVNNKLQPTIADSIKIKDRATEIVYSLYIENGELRMEVAE